MSTTETAPRRRRRSTCCASLLAVATASMGCARTDVITAPHADPGELSTGVVLERRLGSGRLATGVVAVNEARRGDLVWRTDRGGSRLELCRADVCMAPAAAPGTEMPNRNLAFLETSAVRATSPRAGVWVRGGRFLPTVYHCRAGQERPVCEQARVEGRAVPALQVVSTHSLRRGAEVEDVLWVALGNMLTRCERVRDETRCRQLVAP